MDVKCGCSRRKSNISRQAFENKCNRKLLRMPWTKLMTTEQVYTLAKTDKQLHSHVKSRKLRYFGHVMRQPQDSIENSVMTWLVEGSRSCGRLRMCWFDNIKAWSGLSASRLLHTARDRGCWSSFDMANKCQTIPQHCTVKPLRCQA